MKKTTQKKRYFIYALIVIIFLVALFLVLTIWDKQSGNVPVLSTGEITTTYKGQNYSYKEDIETFLVIGLDKFDGEEVSDSHENGVQADFLMLFVVDNHNKECSAIQINRDTMTKVNKLSVGGTYVVDTYEKQIALAYNYVNDDNDKIRCRNTKDSVEYLLNGIKVDHYLSVTMDVVPLCCDIIGGVEVTVLDDFTGIDDTLVKGENVLLSGEQALTYVRARYGLEDSSNTARMARQQQFIKALYRKISYCLESDDSLLSKLAKSLNNYVIYDSSDQKMLTIIEKFNNYEFLSLYDIKGEYKVGEEFMEFYPDNDSVESIILDLFYDVKQSID